MFCGTLLTIKVESASSPEPPSFLNQHKERGVGKSVRRDFNLNYELGILEKKVSFANNEHENVTPL